ncbi:hypothetical protein ACHAXR_013062 [Thalassiosira sp. AJA248-18]
MRYGFDVIKIQTGSSTCLAAEADSTTGTFDLKPLLQLPPSLEHCVVAQYKDAPHSKYICYEDIFKHALMFSEQILEPFLPKLKDHLEVVHACLEGVDEWLNEPNKNISTIEKTFGMKLDIPTEADYLGQECGCDEGTHVRSNICLQCHCPYGSHQNVWSGECSKRRCPKGNTFFKCKKSHVLRTFKSCDCSLLLEAGYVRRRFEIEKEDELMKLRNFIDLMSSFELEKKKQKSSKSQKERSDSYPESVCRQIEQVQDLRSKKLVGPEGDIVDAEPEIVTIQGDLGRAGSIRTQERRVRFWNYFSKVRGRASE